KVLRFQLDETLPREHLPDAARRKIADELKDQFVFHEAVLARGRDINALRSGTARRRRAGAGRTRTGGACTDRTRARGTGADGDAGANRNSGADDRTDARRFLGRTMPRLAIALVGIRNVGAVAFALALAFAAVG